MSWPDTYSQFDEQHAILKHFGGKQDGRFLDIGAYDAKVFSNTRALFERGWSGVLIEVSPHHVAALIKEYGDEARIAVVCAAASLADEWVTIYSTEDMVSTSNAEHHQKYTEPGANQAKFNGTFIAHGVTWGQINHVFGAFQFVSIDAEGISVDLFHAMIASGATPECVCVEHDSRMTELCAKATERGYKLLYSNGTNAVFGRQW